MSRRIARPCDVDPREGGVDGMGGHFCCMSTNDTGFKGRVDG